MKAKLGKMRATVGYANFPGLPCVEKHGVVIATPATNMPPESGIDYFVARVDNPGYSIGVEEFLIDILGDCIVCDVCGEIATNHVCPICEG